MKTYEIHHKGEKPYSVEVDEHDLHIYTQLWDNENEYWAIHKLIHYTPYQRIFIGDNELHLDRFAKKGLYPGNTILAQIREKEYLFIGRDIFTFEVDEGDEIVSYYSPIDEADVSYPYALGKNSIYFLLDQCKGSISGWNLFADAYQERCLHSFDQKHIMIKPIHSSFV